MDGSEVGGWWCTHHHHQVCGASVCMNGESVHVYLHAAILWCSQYQSVT